MINKIFIIEYRRDITDIWMRYYHLSQILICDKYLFRKNYLMCHHPEIRNFGF